MGRKGEGGHLKRKPAPKLWPIHRKEAVWTVMPKPGPHSLSRSLPLALVIRDMLGFAKTAKEAKKIISNGKIRVNGKIRKDERFLVGLMDVVSIPEIKKFFRVLPSKKGLLLHTISSDDVGFKLSRIENKTIVKGGTVSLDLDDGSNFLIDADASQSLEKEIYNTLNVLKVSIPDRELLGYMKLNEGSIAIVIGGKNMGQVGKVVMIEKQADKKRRDLLVTLKNEKGNQFQTILDYVFVVGDTTSSISLPEID
ncbi:30S ribosomal protein S4e [Candidatus Bathyarchaeota archaeon]|nr:30S ribosomal protein S4e [Candidatus Bathyarchaeota archaeon]